MSRDEGCEFEEPKTEMVDAGIANSAIQDTVVSSTMTSVHSPVCYTFESDILCFKKQDALTKDYTRAISNTKLNSKPNVEYYCSWLTDHNKALCQLTDSPDDQRIKYLLTIYAKNIKKCTTVLNSEFSTLAILKKHIHNVLLFYHFYWCSHKERIDEHYFYLQKMSDILIVFVNLELKFFQNSIDKKQSSIEKISSTLINSLYIYLDNSEEHIFKVLLKSELISEQNDKIFPPITHKCLLNAIANKVKLTNVKFIRYILLLKLWKSVTHDQDQLKKIDNLGLDVIGSDLSSVCLDYIDFFPQPTNKYNNKTMWYLQTRFFNLEHIINKFLSFEEEFHQTPNELSVIKKPINDHNVNDCNVRRRKRLGNNEIILIDLTEESNEIKSQKNVRIGQNLKWLNNFKKRRNVFVNKLTTPDNIIEPYNFSAVHMNSESCDSIKYHDLNILTDADAISQTNDITKDRHSLPDDWLDTFLLNICQPDFLTSEKEFECLVDVKHWKKEILKTNDTVEREMDNDTGENIFNEKVETLNISRKRTNQRHGRKRSASLSKMGDISSEQEFNGLINVKHWKKKILKTGNKKVSRNSTSKVELNKNDENHKCFEENKKKQHGRRKSGSSMKIEDVSSSKIKVSKLQKNFIDGHDDIFEIHKNINLKGTEDIPEHS